MSDIYDTEFDLGEDIYTVEQFKAAVKDHLLVDDDGIGSPAKGRYQSSKIVIRPSRILELPPDATHVVWYSK